MANIKAEGGPLTGLALEMASGDTEVPCYMGIGTSMPEQRMKTGRYVRIVKNEGEEDEEVVLQWQGWED